MDRFSVTLHTHDEDIKLLCYDTDLESLREKLEKLTFFKILKVDVKACNNFWVPTELESLDCFPEISSKQLCNTSNSLGERCPEVPAYEITIKASGDVFHYCSRCYRAWLSHVQAHIDNYEICALKEVEDHV